MQVTTDPQLAAFERMLPGLTAKERRMVAGAIGTSRWVEGPSPNSIHICRTTVGASFRLAGGGGRAACEGGRGPRRVYFVWIEGVFMPLDVTFEPGAPQRGIRHAVFDAKTGEPIGYGYHYTTERDADSRP